MGRRRGTRRPLSAPLEGLLALVCLYLPGHFVGGRLAQKDDALSLVVLLRVLSAFAFAVPILTLCAVLGVFRGFVICTSALAVLAVLGLTFRGKPAGGSRRRPEGWDLAPALLALGGLALYGLPAEYVVNTRDPGVYTVVAARLARSGELFHHDGLISAVSSFHTFVEGREYPGFFILRGDLVVPQFFPGPFALLGLGDLAGGVWGALYVVPIVGAVSVAAAFALGREVFGRWAGLFGAALLAVSYTQVWWTRHPSSEVMAQLFILSGLWLAVRFTKRSDPLTGVMAGLLLGAAMLVRVDAFLGALGLPLLFIWDLFVQRERRDAPRSALCSALRWLYPGVPLALFAACALAYLETYGSRYLSVILSEHGPGDLLTAASLTLTVLLIALVTFLYVRRRWDGRVGGLLSSRSERVGVGVSLCVVALCLWGYFVAPVPWETLPEHSREYDAYRAQILVRLVWFTTPPVAVLGLCGFVLACRRMSRGLFAVLVALLAFGLLYTFVPNVAPDLPWATRRFVPLAFPALCLLAGYAIVEVGGLLARVLGLRVRLVASAGVFGVALGWTLYLIAPILTFQELDGAVAQFARVNEEIPPARVVYVEAPEGYDPGASTFEYLYGRPVLAYDRLRFIEESDELEESGLLRNAVYITTDGGPAPEVGGLRFRQVGEGEVRAPRIKPAETRVPDEKEHLETKYRIFRVSGGGGGG